MARILGIDYGKKRSGIAVTDPLQIIVSGLETVATNQLLAFLTNYMEQEAVEKIVIGMPVHDDGQPTDLENHIQIFIQKFRQQFPGIDIDRTDESFSSSQAKVIIRQSGKKKKARERKALVDKISAVLILQQYLGHC